MKSEYDSLIKNETWELVPPPKGSKIIGNKWMFRTKLEANSFLDKYKSRVGAKRFQQTARVDYTKIFSPIVKPTTTRIMLILTLSRNWNIKK